MAAYATLTLALLASTANEVIIDRLLRSDAVSGFTQVAANQINAWREQLDLLRTTAHKLIEKCPDAGGAALVLEYRIPRREKRLDAALLLKNSVIVLEFKVGAKAEGRAAVEQVMDYAMDLAYYHAETLGKRVVPVLCVTGMRSLRRETLHDIDGVESMYACGSESLGEVLNELFGMDSGLSTSYLDAGRWVRSAYRPIPGVIEAAVRLYQAHTVEDIRSSLSGEQRITEAVQFIDSLIQRSRTSGKKILCLLTGVPGAGKTLAGLQVAHMERLQHTDWRSVFMSGNGPLLKVLRAALTRDYAKQQKIPLAKAKGHAESLLHSVHAYLAETNASLSAPVERIVVFDEAQRAWDSAKMQKMSNRATRLGALEERLKTSSNESEPWQILSALDRHEGGAVIVALCGNGQEIHDGEAGVAEWVRARDQGYPDWELVCSDVARQLAGIDPSHPNTFVSSAVHLHVPVRAHRARQHARWVDAVLASRPEDARTLVDHKSLPIYVTRDIEVARSWLWETTVGTRRCGILASSGAARLRPYGIEVSSDFRKGVDYALWFTGDREDLRSSYALEVASTEFECQGLELDRVALCWSWDMPVIDGRVEPRTYRGVRWSKIDGERERTFISNKYRVLLTRAREGMVIWVPRGRAGDQTRLPEEVDDIANYLLSCGARSLDRDLT